MFCNVVSISARLNCINHSTCWCGWQLTSDRSIKLINGDQSVRVRELPARRTKTTDQIMINLLNFPHYHVGQSLPLNKHINAIYLYVTLGNIKSLNLIVIFLKTTIRERMCLPFIVHTSCADRLRNDDYRSFKITNFSLK